MRYKLNDIPYCGCRADKIKTAMPVINEENFRHLHTWIIERYRIHILKDIEKKSAPWTQNKILQEFRFTNVRREHDKETKWCIDNICSIDTDKDMSFVSKLCNLILFRMFNKSETCKNFMPINFDKGVDWSKILAYMNSVPKNYVFFTNAFKTSGVKMACCKELGYTSNYTDPINGIKPELVVIRFVEKLYEMEEYMIPLGCATPDIFLESLRRIPGFGPFLSYQILVDYTYCKECPWSENEIVIAGPGARRGLDCIFSQKDGMTYEECLFWLRDNWVDLCKRYNLYWNPDEIFTDLPIYDRYMNVMSLQNCMCEISKYIRAVNGTGRPRNKYNGRGHNEQ